MQHILTELCNKAANDAFVEMKMARFSRQWEVKACKCSLSKGGNGIDNGVETTKYKRSNFREVLVSRIRKTATTRLSLVLAATPRSTSFY